MTKLDSLGLRCSFVAVRVLCGFILEILAFVVTCDSILVFFCEVETSLFLREQKKIFTMACRSFLGMSVFAKKYYVRVLGWFYYLGVFIVTQECLWGIQTPLSI